VETWSTNSHTLHVVLFEVFQKLSSWVYRPYSHIGIKGRVRDLL